MEKKKVKVVTWQTYNSKDHPGEKNDGVSMTRPSQTLTLSELLHRQTQGGDVPLFTGVYDDVESFTEEDLSKFDKVQLAQYAMTLAEEKKEAEEYLKFLKAQEKENKKEIEQKEKEQESTGESSD
jgi:hypothetical protein